jgi:hypothetical protein
MDILSILALSSKFLIEAAGIDKKLFNSLYTVNDKIDYLIYHGFKLLGKGSGRTTWALSSKRALKVALNNAGKAQNQLEFELLSSNNSEYLPKVYDISKDASWIEVELVRQLTNVKELEDILGVPISDFYLVATNYQYIITDGDWSDPNAEKVMELLGSHATLKGLFQIATKLGILLTANVPVTEDAE